MTALAQDVLAGKVFYGAGGKEPQTGTMPVMAGQTVTPGSVAQNLATEGKYLSGNISVAAIPATYRRWARGSTALSANGRVTGLGFTPKIVFGRGEYLWPDGRNSKIAVIEGDKAYAVYSLSDIRGVALTFFAGGFESKDQSIPFVGDWIAFS